ncbi:MAG: 4'-phosphopantetheinyl transferase superfamily protein [Gemmatimonadales bacterium]|nr:MAG: 4'-phosphopantetheinyl transferase superfamily protein [Gemmatimonadales bacterium]
MSSEEGGGRDVWAGLHLAWARWGDVPTGEDWLSPREREVLGGLKLPKRRGDWLLGRWAAKCAVSSLLGRSAEPGPASSLEILADPDGRPRPFTEAPGGGNSTAPGPRESAIHLSISHAGGVGFAVAGRGGSAVGCDVEVVESRSDAFVSDYFTDSERALVRRATAENRAVTANLIWSAKESALKVLGEGLRMDTRQVEVDPESLTGGGNTSADAEWHPLGVSGPGGTRFGGSWRSRDGLVWTVLSAT